MRYRRERRRSTRFRNTVLAWSMIAVGGCSWSLAPPETVAPRYDGPIQSRDIAEGRRIYVEVCTACHGGRVNPRGYHWSPGQMRHQIREGNRLMPPLDDRLLSDAQVEAVLAYLRAMGSLEGELPELEPEPQPQPTMIAATRPQPEPEPAPAPAVEGDPEDGDALAPPVPLEAEQTAPPPAEAVDTEEEPVTAEAES